MKKYTELIQDGLTMRGYHHITGSDEVLVMFHGFTGNKTETSYMFKKISGKLEQYNMDSIRYDYFGSGESDGLFSDMTLDVLLKQAKTILDYVRSKKYSKIHILGFSMGGALAMNLLHEADKTILIAPAIEFHISDKKATALKELPNGNYAYNCFELNKHLFGSFDRNYTELAESHKKPVLIIQGKEDSSVNYKPVVQLSTSFDQCKLELIEKGTHIFSSLELYDLLEQTIISYLIDKN